MQIAYLDCGAGLSGDMFLSCLVDAGWSIDDLRAAVGALHLPAEEYAISAEPVLRGPIRATHVKVEVRKTLHKRNLADIEKIIQSSALSPRVKANALSIFNRLAEAEAKVHGVDVSEVHFHEVGAVDAIVDIVGAAAGMEALAIEQLYASPVPLGEGWINAAHGQLPVPAPATAEILATAGIPVRPAPGPGELLTPTGAAILATLAKFEQPAMALARIGTGAGSRQTPWPNVARLMIGQSSAEGAEIVQIETNIDDMNPQLYESVVERLFAAGALDVWLAPVQMKKGRPGVILNVLAAAAKERELAGIILRETTTLGLRVRSIRRHEGVREMRTLATSWGPVRIKLKVIEGQVVAAVPEYSDVKNIADETGLSARQIHEQVAAEALRQFMPHPQGP